MKYIILFCALLFASITGYSQNLVVSEGAQSKRASQPGADVSKMLDGDNSTIYHSKWDTNAIPDTVDFYFYNVKSINELRYMPRPAGTNGIWQSVDVYYTTIDDPQTFIKKGATQSWANDNTLKTFNFAASPIAKPAIIRLVISNATDNFSSCAEIKFYSSETGNLYSDVTCDLGSHTLSDPDIKVLASSATANTANGDGLASYSIDNDRNTMYHSRYSPSKFEVSPSNPAILTYNFTNNPTIDYLVYYPRLIGDNGNFGEVEVLYKLNGQTTFTSLLTNNIAFRSAPSIITFPSTLQNVVAIQIIVKTGAGGFASCSEMMFYKKQNFDNSISGGIFNDDLYTALKPGTTQAQVDAISNSFFKAMANCMMASTYNYRYRTQEYQPHGIVKTLAAKNKTAPYSEFENPTGIYFDSGSEVIIFVGPQAASHSISLKVADLTVHGAYVINSYYLKPGFNSVSITTGGLGYIDYFTDNVSATPVKINIASGKINGVFDVTKDSPADWMWMAHNTVHPKIDLVGKYISLLYDKDLLKKYNPTDIRPLISLYDSVVNIQFQQMGFGKYNIMPKNRMFAIAHHTGGLYAGGVGMHFDYSWGEENYVSVQGILNKDDGDNIWGVAHELGHYNQLRPSLKWIGMTEVTNNIYSTYAQFTMGPSKYVNIRYERENEGGVIGGSYRNYFNDAIISKKNFAAQSSVRGNSISFWQLQLYYQFAGALRGAPTFEERISGAKPAPTNGDADYAMWLGDMMQVQRGRNDTGVSNGQHALNYVKDACDAVKEDLTDYFLKIGLLKAIDTTIVDYTSQTYKITQSDVDATIASIKAKNYPAPVSPVIYYLSAHSLNAFKNKLLADGIYKQGVVESNNQLTISHSDWKNVVVYEIYDTADKLLEISIAGMGGTTNMQTILSYPANADYVWAVSYDGSKKLVYARSAVLPVALISFDAKLVANAAELKWSTSSEKNNKKFELYSSTDGVDFTKIAEIVGNGTKETPTNYQYLDKSFKQSAYYKLVQIDFNGTTTSYDKEVRFVKGLDNRADFDPS
ncbi:MAG: hypothetical protein EOP47_20820, partial [Sphingobacteriaceae bacterium]